MIELLTISGEVVFVKKSSIRRVISRETHQEILFYHRKDTMLKVLDSIESLRDKLCK